MKPRVLLLEDDPAIAHTVVYSLEREGFAVEHHALVQAAAASAASRAPDAAVLDVALPDGNGLELCRRWRAPGIAPALATLPVLMLTARGEEIDRVLGLEAGADDYLAKPFSPRELAARLRALLRRAAMPPHASAEALERSLGPFRLDEAGQRVHFAGQPLALTRLEFGLLRELLLAGGRIVRREALLTRVWGSDTEALDRTVDTHLKTLRAKLRAAEPDTSTRDLIATHRGLGWSIDVTRGGDNA